MSGAIFLSASVPNSERSPQHAKTADSVAISSAVSALVHVALGRRTIIWGGHPAITPMIWVVAEAMGLNYGSWVKLYQSRYFEDQYPEDNKRFNNVVYVDAVSNDRNESLFNMRTRMLRDNKFAAGVFIGGMDGILTEYNLFKSICPQAVSIPIASTGGAVLEIFNSYESYDNDLIDDFDYVSVMHRHLKISTKEKRYKTPQVQPRRKSERLWQRTNKKR